MSTAGINVFPVKSDDEYWIRLEKSLEHLLPFLQHKHEYGTSDMCSEYGIQLALAHSAERIAKKQNIDSNKTKCICMAVGLCFPMFGTYGMLACEKYIIDNNIPLNKNEMKIGAIELLISEISSSVISPSLDEALHAYYENSTDIPEVNVARYCQIKVKESRAMMKNGISASESIQNVMDDVEECFSVEHSIIVDDVGIDIPNEIQEEVSKNLDGFIDVYGIPNGIFEFITS